MTTLQATEGNWLFNGESYAKSVFTSTPEIWMEVSEEYKNTHHSSEEKTALIEECKIYAEGLKKVNFHGNLVWLTPDQRGNYRDTLNAAKALGEESITYGGVTMTIEEAITALNLVDVYAMRVTLKEQAHEAAIKALSDAEVEDYDYKTGYPTQLTF